MKKYIPIAVIVAVFILSSFVSQEYSEDLGEIISRYKVAGLITYFFAVILAIVAAPLTSIPLIPLVVGVWGVFWTVILSVFAWTLGSAIAFWIARRFGAPLTRKLVFIDEKKKYLYEHISDDKRFWYLIFLRMIIPVDILSYALGLFTSISWKLFITTTFLGIIPMVTALSFFGVFPVKYQIMIFIGGSLLLVSFIFLNNLRKKKNKGN